MKLVENVIFNHNCGCASARKPLLKLQPSIAKIQEWYAWNALDVHVVPHSLVTTFCQSSITVTRINIHNVLSELAEGVCFLPKQ